MATRVLLKKTTSRCPVCKAACPGEVWKPEDGSPGVYLSRICAEHGENTACIASDSRFYWLASGEPGNACCGGKATLGRNAAGRCGAAFDTLSTCIALIEIVNSCNLECPTCFAASPLGDGKRVDAVPLADLQRRIQGIVDRKGGIEILQLSGGEPTLHPQFFDLVAWVQAHEKIDYVVVNTNGVRIATDDAFVAELAVATARKGLQLYLQYDGPQADGQFALRGADLRNVKSRAVERCGAMGLPITLAMTVSNENLPFAWEAARFGLEHPHIHGITYQPMFQSGRFAAPGKRLNAADILLSLIAGSEGLLSEKDFTPLPCGDPNCAIIGYLIRKEGGFYSISDFVDFSRLQGFLQDRLKYNLDDLVRCGCDVEPLGEVLKELEIRPDHPFRMMVKPFMDAWTWDQDRIDRCCTHVIRPDGKLDSFCRYYSGFPDTWRAP
ncbi:MAG TPA: radical SAM protein [Kiritimatiellia bacterium]|jgi:hypothetical protein